jgi:hypothetical protein
MGVYRRSDPPGKAEVSAYMKIRLPQAAQGFSRSGDRRRRIPGGVWDNRTHLRPMGAEIIAATLKETGRVIITAMCG